MYVTKRCNSGNRCNSTNNNRRPQKAHSKTESRPTSADQQHKNGSTQTRPQTDGDDKKHSTRTGAEETKQHTRHPTALSANKSMRLHPDTRERFKRSTAPTATTEAPGKSPAPKRYLAPSRHRQSWRHTNDTTTPTIHHVPHRGAVRGRAMHCPTNTRPSKKLRDHRRCSSGTRNATCAAQPAKTPNSEPAGTTVATSSMLLSFVTNKIQRTILRFFL